MRTWVLLSRLIVTQRNKMTLSVSSDKEKKERKKEKRLCTYCTKDTYKKQASFDFITSFYLSYNISSLVLIVSSWEVYYVQMGGSNRPSF